MSTATTIKASDVINQALPPGQQPFVDNDFTTVCSGCGAAITLADCVITQEAETTYLCPTCRIPLLIIGAPNEDGKPWPGRGYKIGDFVLRNATDLRIGIGVIDRSPNALATSR